VSLRFPRELARELERDPTRELTAEFVGLVRDVLTLSGVGTAEKRANNKCRQVK